ncbi:ABC transporter permease [Longitalea luteola]|uniref:ABC transporter permease n=1 Tax=Longitalea luteola TaxID=2812563 RepID=UPI001A96DFCA|nr:ABC transporter permease [Longitalea luteola]
MIKNFLKIAFRNIRNSAFYSFISVFGLAIGLTAGILILLWCEDEKSYNQSTRDAKNVYRAIPGFISGGDKKHFSTVPSALAYVSKQVPGIEKVGRIIANWNQMVLHHKGKTFSEKRSAFIDPALFDMLDFSFIVGNRGRPFENTRSIVLTEPFAKKYFGNEDPLGKIITRQDVKESYTVTGVVKMLHNSQTNFDFFLPLDIINEYFGNPADSRNGVDGDWNNYDYEMYVRLHHGTSATEVAAQLTQLQKENVSDDITKTLNYRLQPLADIHLYNTDGSPGLITMVRIFTVVAFIILLIASINYINLTTAKAAQRAREIGVRKIIGAAKRQLFFQFISETIVVFLLATGVSILLIQLVFPLFNQLTGKQLAFNLFDPAVSKVLGVTLAITLAASSIYPALLLSSFRPLQAIKGKFSISRGNHFMRKVLVVSQFCFSVIFIISTIIIGKQLNYIGAKNLGLNKENVFRIELKNMRGKYEAVKNELLSEPSISGITGAGQNVLNVASNTTKNDWPGKDPGRTLLITSLPVERDFVSVMHLRLVAGKGFSGTLADSACFILNETAIREMGLKDPVGKPFTFYQTKGTIAGIVQDFHFKDMHQKIGPCALFWKPEWVGQLHVRATQGHTTEAIAAVKRLWQKYNPEFPFEYNFLDDAYDKMYAADQRISTLFKVFAFIAIFISCLGLFGLMMYTAQLKTREIGIRKVLGASVSSVTALLAKDFVYLVLLAVLIASPIGWYFMNRWLQDFAYRTAFSWWIFPVAGIAVLFSAALTISLQAIKTALANPIKSLRTE